MATSSGCRTIQNVPTDFDSTSPPAPASATATCATPSATSTKRRELAWNLVFAGDRVKGKSFPKVSAPISISALALPLRHSSLWLRSSAGYSSGDRDEPFANFFFGGFGNNWVDRHEEKRYREWYAFPGVELNEIGGQELREVDARVEPAADPIPARRARPGFYVTWARPALFASDHRDRIDTRSVRRDVSNAGAQLDFRLTVLSRFDLTLSVGHAVAFEDGAHRRDETMVSLKVLK